MKNIKVGDNVVVVLDIFEGSPSMGTTFEVLEVTNREIIVNNDLRFDRKTGRGIRHPAWIKNETD
ncbi:TPA: hypothetical protein DDW35_10420 [Candidatus Sumerlaeota bacterium]|jgi:hypothetical protein|nr:hypothetical protein [Candidatus Sumerlaeota bacterium]